MLIKSDDDDDDDDDNDDGETKKLASACKDRSPITLRLKHSQLKGDFLLLLTQILIKLETLASSPRSGMDIY